MKKMSYRFTLVEMLTVIAIIGVLAAIITPVVIIARNRGQKSRAESDVVSIVSALKQMDTDCKKVLDKDNKIGGKEATVSSNIATLTGDAYDAMIAELSVPKNIGLTAVSVNKRKKVYLEPRKDFDPTKSYANQKDLLYRDPWGNPYKILIKTTHDDELATTYKTIVGNFAVYSFGPNKSDDNGCNSDKPICGSDNCKHDDVSSWAM